MGGTKTVWNKIKPYVISIAIALAVGGLSAVLTNSKMAMYSEVNKPVWSPPTWLFPVVWSILFVLMGIGAALVWVNREKDIETARSGLFVYGLQLVVNFFWSIIFFNMQAYFFALVWLILLLALIVVMIFKFKKINTAAALMQIPYVVWVAFAGVLTAMVYLMNR